MNGDRTWMSARNQDSDEITKWLALKVTQNGDTTSIRYRKHWQTEVPSVQGPWTPFTHRNPELNLADFPNIVLGEPLNKEQTATEKLLELASQKPVQAQTAALESKE